MNALAADVISELLSKGHSVRFTADGDSMDPVIRSGDVLHVDPVDAAQVRAGHVVLTNAPRGLTAHRVASVGAGGIVTRGDRAAEADEPLPLSAVLGLVTALDRAGRTIPVRRCSPLALAALRFALKLQRRLTR